MSIENTRKKIEELVKVCVLLRQVLCNFEQVVIRENDAVRRSDINELEVITSEKIAFGLAIEDRSQKIRYLMEEIRSLTSASQQSEEPFLLDDLKSHLCNWALTEPNSKIILENINQLAAAVQSLAEVRLNIFPKLEANSYLVKKLLQYHQETCQFWLEFANESEAVYGKSGRFSASTQRSILTVRT